MKTNGSFELTGSPVKTPAKPIAVVLPMRDGQPVLVASPPESDDSDSDSASLPEGAEEQLHQWGFRWPDPQVANQRIANRDPLFDIYAAYRRANNIADEQSSVTSEESFDERSRSSLSSSESSEVEDSD